VNEKNLLVAKSNILEVYVFQEDGLKLLHSLTIFGRIAGLESFQSTDCSTASVFVLTDRKKFCILSYDAESQKVVTRAVGNVKERKGRDAEMGQRAFMDPDFRVAGLQLYDSTIKIIPLEKSSVADHFNISLEENRILDMKFIHGCSRPTMCLLYEDNRRTRHVKTVSIDMREKTAVTGPWHRDNVEFTASMLIPVPSPINGVLVVGINTITYIGTSGLVQTVEISPAMPTSFCQIDKAGTRYLIGNVKGNMLVVALVVDTNFKVVGITTDMLGNTAIAETINYIDNGVVFVGSSLGDSQLIKLLSQPMEANGHIEILDSFLNIGPILDMCVVDDNKSGTQKQLVTCSGYDRIGSLRVIRSGIGIHEQASLEIPGIKGLWSLRTSETTEFDKFLIQSFVGETRILSIEGEEMGEIEIPSLNAALPSLFCGNMAGGLMLQVTAAGVRLIDCTSFDLVFELLFAKNVTVATANLTQIVLALSGGSLVYLELSADGKTLNTMCEVTLDQDIACLSLKPTAYETVAPTSLACATENGNMDVDTTTSAVNFQEKSSLLVVGMWTDNTVRLFAVPSLEEITRNHLETTTQSRDVVIVTFEESLFVFVGMGDGGFITYTIDASSGSVQLTSRRKGILGTRPITFTRFVSSSSNELCVFASCDRPTVIYIRNGKILFSMLDLKTDEVTNMTPFHSELFPDCLALSSDNALMIGTVEDIQKMHVRTIPLDEGPRRIAYSPEHGVYAVLTERTIDNEHGGESKNRILFFDEGFEQIGSFDLDYLEQNCSLAVCQFIDCSKPYFVVGTGQVVAEELEPSRGRILVFDVIPESKRCVLVAERDTKAAVYSLTGVAGRLAAGIANRVQIFKFVKKDEQINIGSYSIQAELQPECSVAEHIMVLYLKAHGEYLVVGDVHRSISLLKYKPMESAIEEVARDFNSSMMRAVETLTNVDDHYIGADDHANLFVAKYRGTTTSGANSEENHNKLSIVCEYHLGDYINVLRQGTIVAQPMTAESATVVLSSSAAATMDVDGPTTADAVDIFHSNYRTVTGYPLEKNSVLFGTISGMIGSIIALNESSFQFFQAVQNAMRKVYRPVDGLLHEEWRIFQNDYRTGSVKHVVDGDLVEAILDLDRAGLEAVTRDVNDQLTGFLQPAGLLHGGVGSSSTESAATLMTSLATGRVNLSPEDVLRRVEDISRLH
jgi:DNA damage-binding protein 1